MTRSAAARDKSLSELLRESLEEKVSEATGYRQADGVAVEAPCDRIRSRAADGQRIGALTIRNPFLHE